MLQAGAQHKELLWVEKQQKLRFRCSRIWSTRSSRTSLSSVHQAKGLEWRVVFLIWLSDGRFPSARSLREPEGEEEERRLFYVALTRARDELYVTYPIVENERGRQTVIQRPSRFVLEVPRSLFEIWNVDEEPIAFDVVEETKLIH